MLTTVFNMTENAGNNWFGYTAEEDSQWKTMKPFLKDEVRSTYSH